MVPLLLFGLATSHTGTRMKESMRKENIRLVFRNPFSKKPCPPWPRPDACWISVSIDGSFLQARTAGIGLVMQLCNAYDDFTEVYTKMSCKRYSRVRHHFYYKLNVCCCSEDSERGRSGPVTPFKTCAGVEADD